jgi:hypothetical protein
VVRSDVTLPPGQHRIEGFPRFGPHYTEGVSFETFYRVIIEPSLREGVSISHLVFALSSRGSRR